MLITPRVAAYKIAVDDRRESGNLRSLREFAQFPGAEITIDGKTMVNFASNDYLGLSKHEYLKERSCQALEEYGVGLGSTRLLAGNIGLYDQVERKLAQLKGTQTALLMSTGFQANSTILSALCSVGALAASDRHNHSSILHGLTLSRGRWFRYEHRDLIDLENKLQVALEHEIDGPIWIITESLFSTDGDFSDMNALTALAAKYGAMIYVDEAHSIGVYGQYGGGIPAIANDTTVYFGTFGKALGCFGAYVACPQIIKDYLINYCAGVLYSAALPPAVLGAMSASLDLLPNLHKEREFLQQKSSWLRARLSQIGYRVDQSSSHIIPLIIGGSKKALELAAFLESRSIFAPPLRPPTVPAGTARVRLLLTAMHTREHLNYLVRVLEEYAQG